ncbi:MAG: phospholipase D/transphosphatidylase [uncultured bacterium (gcode 4)]|uniref:phospholipase D n=1 Tax=uncultured bacterium (gcode 4) TaxID=1234023 RepID=K1XI88_9BACT|nr:MAG: phospholipase D/transphosphatidylase [uncultured bacterium (gcode 4)]
MKKKLLGRGVFVIIVIIGLALWDVQIQFGTYSPQASAKSIHIQLTRFQDISWSFFRSPGESLDKELSSFWTTQQNLDLRTYEFTQKEFKPLLKTLAQKDINIRIIVEDKKFQQFQNTLKVLSQYYSWNKNIQLKSDKQMGTEYTHAKVNLIDSGFIIQTANLTNSSFASNREHFFQSTDTWIRKSLHTIFEKDRIWIKITMQDIHPNLVVCNINCRGVIEQLLSSAKDSIIIQTQYITDDALRNILKTKKSLPEFKLLVADTDDNDELIRYFGNEYARKFKKYYNHTKMILIDHKILLLGSMNLSATSLDKNREIGIILLDTSIIKTFSDQFTQDWTASAK